MAQRPAPLQAPVSSEHGQAVSGPGNVHVLALPLQKPAQVPVPAQALRWPCGAWREGIGQQLPRWPLTSQAWHGSAHGESQQTPSTQRPLWHCPSPLQVTPFGRAAVQAVAWQ
jgi:hypothetical protein